MVVPEHSRIIIGNVGTKCIKHYHRIGGNTDVRRAVEDF